jgi:hypothetical protein
VITVLPALTPVTVPVDGSTVATPASLPVQLPPAVPSLSVTDDDTHTDSAPLMDSIGSTVTS